MARAQNCLSRVPSGSPHNHKRPYLTEDEIFDDMLSLLRSPKKSKRTDNEESLAMLNLMENSFETLNLPEMKENVYEEKSRKILNKEDPRDRKLIESSRRATSKRLLGILRESLEKHGVLKGIEAVKSTKSRYSVEKIHIIRGATFLLQQLQEKKTRLLLQKTHENEEYPSW